MENTEPLVDVNDEVSINSLNSQDTPSRLRAYKNFALNSDELRRRREEAGVQLRKQRRSEQLFKRRNVQHQAEQPDAVEVDDEQKTLNVTEEEDLLDASSSSPMQANNGITPRLVEMLYFTEPIRVLEAVQRLRKILSREPNPPIAEVVAAGLVPRLVEILSKAVLDSSAETLSGSSGLIHRLLFETAWALTNIASGSGAQTLAVVEAGAVSLLITLIKRNNNNLTINSASGLSNRDIQEQAVWALGNIAGDSPTCRDFLLQCGILPPLLDVLRGCLDEETDSTSANAASTTGTSNLRLIRNGIWCVSNLCRGKSPPPDFALVSTALPVLAHYLFSTDTEVLTDSCWALSYLADGPDSHLQAVIEAGVGRRLVELVLHPNPLLTAAALRALGNLVTGDDIQTQVVLNCQILPCLAALLQRCPREPVKKEVCWTLSNITAGNCHQIQAVVDANIFPLVIEVLNKGEYKTRKEAAWVITNATAGGSHQQVRYLAQVGCLPPLCELLSATDPRLVHIALAAIDNILRAGQLELMQRNAQGCNPFALMVEECQGLDKIEFLQTHDNQDIYQKAYDLIEKYFAGEDEDRGLLPDSGVIDLRVPSVTNLNSADGNSSVTSSTVPVQQYHFEVNAQLPTQGFSF